MDNSFPILVIEDDPSSRKLLEKALLSAGYKVFIAHNGRNGLEILDKHFFQIVITDWEMPEMNGLEVCRAIRNRDYEWYVYLVILTVKDSKNEIVTGLEAGADDYIIKPFHRAELLARLEIIKRYLSMERSLRQANKQIRILAISDSLTGIYNRGYLTERLPQEINRAKRYNHSLSLVLCDIDHFKMINDSHGHQTGDRVLKEFVDCLRCAVRNGVDWIVRYGGEEFLIVLPETDAKGAFQAAERLRKLISERDFCVENQRIHITASFGVSSLDPLGYKDVCLPESLIDQADKHLYKAKQRGRNRVEGYSHEEESINS